MAQAICKKSKATLREEETIVASMHQRHLGSKYKVSSKSESPACALI